MADGDVSDYDSLIEACTAKACAPSSRGSGATAKSVMKNYRRFVVVGPSKSGKSSLVMDLALSVARREPCRCPRYGESIFQSNRSELRDPVCHNCIAVTLFLPALKDCEFPLLCEKQQFKSKKQHIRKNEHIAVSGSKRINVRHVTSARDIVSYLLSAGELPREKQSFGGFFIDDIDVICSRNDTSSSLIRTSQIGK
jgi:hypothetical protein